MIRYKVINNNTIFNIDQYNKYLSSIDNPNLRKLIYQYTKKFHDFLPENIFFEQKVEHMIKFGNTKPTNINVYLLSKTNKDKQVK